MLIKALLTGKVKIKKNYLKNKLHSKFARFIFEKVKQAWDLLNPPKGLLRKVGAANAFSKYLIKNHR